ncbi:MAG: arcC [Haloplasmataceae bacterium]|jgi:carbamate kinase|nr:arcC [Haloplasmataceae bacterium]
MARIVVALGGNALGNNHKEQQGLVKNTAKSIVDLVLNDHEVIVTHGNGPQVGMINLAFEHIGMPFPECGAMSQGYIGYHLQNAIQNELIKKQIYKKVATVITQVLVDKNDLAFSHPSKPIGSFYTLEEAERLRQEKGFDVIEDAGRGYRRVVPSPLPIDIIEKDIIQSLLDANHLVIASGGGGIPVIKDGNELIGVSAVIDKDYASSKLAELINADYLIILTAVNKVSLNYKSVNQIDLSKISVSDAKEYILQGHFARGSMLPKIEAAVKFAESKKGRISIIAALTDALEALEGLSGTIITL